MKAIFDEISVTTSKQLTNKYSTSFSLGVRFLGSGIRNPIYSIYGFVRLADEIVDSFHGYNKKKLLNDFKADTILAIKHKISLNPVLNAFQETVHKYNIEWELIETFLESMEMDLDKETYNQKEYEKYILGSAEVVGLMCLKVFTGNDKELYQKLKPYAQKLGSAFQKVNFLRDLQADFEGLGRSYFPYINLSQFSEADKKRIEREIEKEFLTALEGIKMLPSSSKTGVYLAYFYYKHLLLKIKRESSSKIFKQRIRIPNSQKLVLLMKSLVRIQMNML